MSVPAVGSSHLDPRAPMKCLNLDRVRVGTLELQNLQIGQGVPMSPTTPTIETAFTVDGFEVHRRLLLVKPASTWVWQLTETAPGTTRLVTRVHAVHDWRKPTLAVLGVVLMEFGFRYG